MSTKDSLLKYSQRKLDELDREQKPSRKNGKPERQVEKEILAWARANGFSLNVIRAEAVYSVRAGRYLNSQVRPGHCDIAGSYVGGLACYIEIKAPGKRSTLRDGQRSFLIDKINQGCFACVADSVNCLEEIWTAFEFRRKVNPMLARNLLLKHLPPERTSGGEGLGFAD